MKKRILALLGTLLTLAIFTAVTYAESPTAETGNLTVNYKVVDEQGNLVDAIEDSQQFSISSTTKTHSNQGDDVRLKTNTLYDFNLSSYGTGQFLVGGNSGGFHSVTIYSLPADIYNFTLVSRSGYALHASDADYIIDSVQLFINNVESIKPDEHNWLTAPVTISSGETVIDIILNVTKPEQVTSATVKFNLYCADTFKVEDNYTITLKGISEKNADVVRTAVATEEDLKNGSISISDVPSGYYEICESAQPRDGRSMAPTYIFSRNTCFVSACFADVTFPLYTSFGQGNRRTPRIVISIYGLNYYELLNYKPVVKGVTTKWDASFTFYWHYPESDGARCGELMNAPIKEDCMVVFPEVPGFTMKDAPTQTHTTSENENGDMIFAMHYVKNSESTTTPTPIPSDKPSPSPSTTPSTKPSPAPSAKPIPTSTPVTVPNTEPTPTLAPAHTPSTEATAAPVSTSAPASTTAPISNTTVRSTPAPSTKPTPSPTPAAEPTATPAPTAEPEPSATPDPAPSSAPDEQPEATQAPTEVKKESKRSMPFWVVPVAVPCVAVGGASFITIFRRRWRK